MIETIIIMVGIVISVALLSKADVMITIKHDYPQVNPQVVDNLPTQADADDAFKETNPPSYDDVLAEVHKILGGDTLE